jgi:Ca2+-binding EF-hand superfamily protein
MADIEDLLAKMKQHILDTPNKGIRYLKVIFRRYDYNGNKKLDAADFEECMTDFGAGFSSDELNRIKEYCDTDGDAQINFEELVRGCSL